MRRFIRCAIMPLVCVAAISSAHAAATVHVKLWDKGDQVDMSKNLGLGLGLKGDMSKATMGIDVDRKQVPAGKVTFVVRNAATSMIHEMLVAPIAGPDAKLPYVDGDVRVDEEGSRDLGEVSELDAGKSGALTLDLKPGLYILFCNIPGHYMSGMWTTIEVR